MTGFCSAPCCRVMVPLSLALARELFQHEDGLSPPRVLQEFDVQATRVTRRDAPHAAAALAITAETTDARPLQSSTNLCS